MACRRFGRLDRISVLLRTLQLDYLPDRTRFGQYDIPTAVSNPLSDYIINDPNIYIHTLFG
jgi:hypothetical protein